MKILLVTLLIIAMVLVVMPLPMGMGGMAWCPACLTGHVGQGLVLCLGILASAILMLGLSMFGPVNASAPVFNKRLLSFSILRPPRFASGL